MGIYAILLPHLLYNYAFLHFMGIESVLRQ